MRFFNAYFNELSNIGIGIDIILCHSWKTLIRVMRNKFEF